MMERRQDSRVAVRLPCHLARLGGKSRQFVGQTKNISRGGVLLEWDSDLSARLPRPGELLDLEVELPANHSFRRKCLYCQVTAVRLAEQGDGRRLVAFQIHQMKFRDSGARTLAAVHSQEELSLLLM